MSDSILDTGTICLVLELGALGTRRKVATSAVDTRGADPELVAVSKEILDCPEYDRIVSAQGDLKRRVRSLALPSQLFSRGSIYMVPVGLVEQADEMIVEAERAIISDPASLLERFLTVYDAATDRARVRLGPMFDPTDYPSPFRVRRAFKVAHSYLSLETPGKLAEISPALFQRERAKAEQKISSMVEDVESALTLALADLCSHMVERLQPSADGKPKIFRDSLVSNFSEFLTTFSARNVSGNADLEAVAERARGLLSGVDAGVLRTVPTIRDGVAAGFAEIKLSLDSMVAARPSRMFL